MNEQKFNKGDHIQVADDLGPSMSHFTSGCEAIVIGSYKDQYGGSDTDSYSLHLKGRGHSSWYHEHQLTLIEPNRIDLLERWEKEAKDEAEMKADIDWIFSHGDEVLSGAAGSTLDTLAGHLGMGDLWGSRGEGITYYSNAIHILSIAQPFLEAGDKGGWLAASHIIREDK